MRWWILWGLLFICGVLLVFAAPQKADGQFADLRDKYWELEREKPRVSAVAFLNVTLVVSAVLFGLALIKRKRRGYLLVATGTPFSGWELAGLFFFFVLWIFHTGVTLFLAGRFEGGFGGRVVADIVGKVMMVVAGLSLLGGQFGGLGRLGFRGGVGDFARGGYLALLSLAPVWAVSFVWSGFAERMWGKDVNIVLAGFASGVQGELPAWTVFAVVVLACVVGPFVEEFLFRVVLYGGLRVFGVTPALLLQAAIFGAFHRPYEAVPIGLLGLMLGYLYERTGSFFSVWTAHALFNGYSLTLTWLQVR